MGLNVPVEEPDAGVVVPDAAGVVVPEAAGVAALVGAVAACATRNPPARPPARIPAAAAVVAARRDRPAVHRRRP